MSRLYSHPARIQENTPGEFIYVLVSCQGVKFHLGCNRKFLENDLCNPRGPNGVMQGRFQQDRWMVFVYCRVGAGKQVLCSADQRDEWAQALTDAAARKGTPPMRAKMLKRKDVSKSDTWVPPCELGACHRGTGRGATGARDNGRNLESHSRTPKAHKISNYL